MPAGLAEGCVQGGKKKELASGAMTANAEDAMLKNLPVVRRLGRLMSAGFEMS
jgi:hypothetical protein